MYQIFSSWISSARLLDVTGLSGTIEASQDVVVHYVMLIKSFCRVDFPLHQGLLKYGALALRKI